MITIEIIFDPLKNIRRIFSMIGVESDHFHTDVVLNPDVKIFALVVLSDQTVFSMLILMCMCLYMLLCGGHCFKASLGQH